MFSIGGMGLIIYHLLSTIVLPCFFIEAPAWATSPTPPSRTMAPSLVPGTLVILLRNGNLPGGLNGIYGILRDFIGFLLGFVGFHWGLM